MLIDIGKSIYIGHGNTKSFGATVIKFITFWINTLNYPLVSSSFVSEIELTEPRLIERILENSEVQPYHLVLWKFYMEIALKIFV